MVVGAYVGVVGDGCWNCYYCWLNKKPMADFIFILCYLNQFIMSIVPPDVVVEGGVCKRMKSISI